MSATTPLAWPIAVVIPVAWGDMDAFQHVNNTVYLKWFESARLAYFEAVGIRERMAAEDVGPILANTSINFRKAVVFPDTVTAWASVSEMRNSSFTMQYRITSAEHDGAVVADGVGVIVMLNYVSGEKSDLGDALRAQINDLEAQRTEALA